MARTSVDGLTPREREIAEIFAGGLGSREVGELLGIAQSTVRTHLLAVYGKLGVRTKVGLVAALRPPASATRPCDPGSDGLPARIAVLRLFDQAAGDAGLQLTGAVAQAVTAALGAYPDVRIALSVPGRGPEPGADLARVAHDLRADYLALPSLATVGGGAELLVHLVDRDGTARWTYAASLPLPCPRDLIAAAAARFAARVAGIRGEIVQLEMRRRLLDAGPEAHAYDLYLAASDYLELTVNGRLQAERNHADTAVALAERAVARDPRLSRAWALLGWCRHDRASFGLAAFDPPDREAATFRRAAELAPSDGLPIVYLALARAKAGAQAEAERLIERAMTFAGRSVDVAAEATLGLACVAGQPARALRGIEDALDRTPDPPAGWRALEARAAFFAGQPERAFRAAESAPDLISALVVQALAAADLRARVEAERAWSRLQALGIDFDFERYARCLPISHPVARAKYEASVRGLHSLLEAV